MPFFEVTAPNGKIYNVEGPPGSTEEEAIAYVRDNMPTTEQQRSSRTVQNFTGTPSETGSIPRSPDERASLGFKDRSLGESLTEWGGAGAGALSGAVSAVAGIPGDLQSLGMGAYRGIQRFISPNSYVEATANQGSQPGLDFLPTSDAIQEGFNRNIPEDFVNTDSFPLYNTTAQLVAPIPPVGRGLSLLGRPSRADRAALLLRERQAGGIGGDIRRQSQIAGSAGTETARRQKLASMLERQQAGLEGPFRADKPRVRSDIGGDVAGAARGRQEGLIDARNTADTRLREVRDQIVAQNEAAGVFVENTDAFKKFEETLRPYVDEVTSGPELRETVVPSVRNLYQKVHDAITTKRIELTPDEASAAINNGHRVETSGDKYYRTFRSSFNAVDELRRYFGEVFSKNNVEGFEAIPANVQKDFYRTLNDIEAEYVGHTPQTELQENWRRYSKELEQYDTRAGRTLTGTQRGTDEFNATSGRVYDAFLGKGRDEITQLIEATGDENLVRSIVNDYLNTQFSGKTPAQIRTLLAPGSKVTDMLSHPSLTGARDAARTYLERVTRGERLGGALSQLREGAEQSAATGSDATRAVADLEILNRELSALPTREVGPKLIQFFDEKLRNGTMSRADHKKMVDEIISARDVLNNNEAYMKRMGEIMSRGRSLLGRAAGWGIGGAIGGMTYNAMTNRDER